MDEWKTKNRGTFGIFPTIETHANFAAHVNCFGFQQLIYYASVWDWLSIVNAVSVRPLLRRSFSLLQVAISLEYRTHVNCRLETHAGIARWSGACVPATGRPLASFWRVSGSTLVLPPYVFRTRVPEIKSPIFVQLRLSHPIFMLTPSSSRPLPSSSSSSSNWINFQFR